MSVFCPINIYQIRSENSHKHMGVSIEMDILEKFIE